MGIKLIKKTNKKGVARRMLVDLDEAATLYATALRVANGKRD